jgi:hypothetical protein
MTSSLLSRAQELAKYGEAKTHTLPPDDIDAVIGYNPRPLQRQIEEEERRFNVEVLHRRFGKTVMKVRKLIHRAAYCPFRMGRYAYLAPTYSQAEDIAWLYLSDFASKIYAELGLREKDWTDKSKLAVYIPCRNGEAARVRLYGVDSPKQRIRGLYLDGAVFDEFAWIPWSVWSEQVRPMLSDDVRQGHDELGRLNQWADFIFTPAGRNHAYTVFRKADQWTRGQPVVETDPETQEEKEVFRDDWYATKMPASETGILGRKELQDALHDMGRSKYDQEYECSFDAAVEGAILAQEIEEAKQQGRVGYFPWNKLLPVHTAWDLGWDDATAIWFFQQMNDTVRVIDYYEAHGAGLDHYADVLAKRGYRYGYMFFPHDVAVHDLGSGKSRESILRELGIRPTTVPKHSLVDGIPAMQALIPRCEFHEPTVAEGLDRLALYRREKDERRGVMREKPLHDWASHGADAFRILAMGLRRVHRGGSDPNRMSHAIF